MNSGGGDFDLCGWRVASEIALPELPPWRGDDRLPEIAIVVGDVAPLVAPTMISPLVAIDAAGCAHFSVDGVADFAVTGGCRITVAPVQSPNTPDVRLFLARQWIGVPLSPARRAAAPRSNGRYRRRRYCAHRTFRGRQIDTCRCFFPSRPSGVVRRRFSGPDEYGWCGHSAQPSTNSLVAGFDRQCRLGQRIAGAMSRRT